MRIHHLNCGTMCPRGGLLLGGSLGQPMTMCCHCLLVETSAGLVLVDTGLGLDDVRQRSARLGRLFTTMVNPILDESETARRRIEALGFSASDVRHIVVTHLDLDHAGGLPDFPEAEVHVLFAEHRAAMSRTTMRQRNRYVPAQWAHDVRWNLHSELAGERWFGFERVRQLGDVPPEVLLVPLLGHSPGHCAVAVRRDTPAFGDAAGGSDWLLHCGDAYFNRVEVRPEPGARTPIGLELFQRAVGHDNRQRVESQRRLRALVGAHGEEVHVFSAHDPVELAALREASPAGSSA